VDNAGFLGGVSATAQLPSLASDITVRSERTFSLVRGTRQAEAYCTSERKETRVVLMYMCCHILTGHLLLIQYEHELDSPFTKKESMDEKT